MAAALSLRPAEKPEAPPKVSTKGVPAALLEDPELNAWIAALPAHYNFEVHKTIARIRHVDARRVALQLPEGLLLFAIPLSDIIERFTGATTVILGDVTYGACCVDDLSAKALDCDFLVHYGHSCLISIRDCCLPNMMYVFVEIQVDVSHFVEMVRKVVPSTARVVMVSTIQFVGSLRVAAEQLRDHFALPITVPQNRPLSGGELLGCTSPELGAGAHDVALYLGDGRFHLESFMIANPDIAAYKYDPYTKALSTEQYDHPQMHAMRRAAIEEAAHATTFGLVLGTLGRQGRPPILERLQRLMEEHQRQYIVVLLSEIFPQKLAMFEGVDAWVQVACPRLSIDWGTAFAKPLLTPYEAEVCLGVAPWREVYPMDHYSKAGGKWAAYTDKA
jgi:2-(3-amino-3-carboxypropyl)histidine synthase